MAPLTRIASGDAIRPLPARGRGIAYGKPAGCSRLLWPAPFLETMAACQFRFLFVLDPIPRVSVREAHRPESKRRKRLENSICDCPALAGDRSRRRRG